MSFVHLKTYTEYSLSSGINRVSDLVEISTKDNMPAIAITDKNGLMGAVEFYKEARSSGLKPIIGVDISVEQEDGNIYQLTLLAKNDNGYKKITALNSKAFTENRKDNVVAIKEEWLSEIEDIVVLSGAKQGLIGQQILAGQYDQAKEIAQQMKDAFGEDFYIELQRDGSPEEDSYMEGAVNICSELKIAPVATHPVLFKDPGDFVAHEARFCIANKYSLLALKRPRPFNKEMYFKSTAEMEELFSDLPQALENTVKIAKKCSTELSLGTPVLPRFPTPNGENEDDYFSHLVHEGLEKRLKEIFKTPQEIAKNRKPYDERLEKEEQTIKKMGFPGYFLIVSDFINWAKDNEIPIGPGRGSGAGSLVAYAMGITDLNPLPYNLLFERFLNPERVSMPDFDIDMCQNRRGEIIDYVRKKYGEQSVCQIGTFGTMAAKAVVRDVGRTLGYPYDFVDSLAKMIYIPAGKDWKLKEFIYGNEEKGIQPDLKIQERYDNEQDVKKLIDIALKLEGLTKNMGTHASGVLISPTLLTDFTPLYTPDMDSKPVSQFNMGDVEKAGLVKFDFLGLRNLTIIKEAIDLINSRHENKLDINTIPLDDAEVYKNVFANGNTTSIFQFESKGMKGVLQKARPDKFEDLAALNALYRPGPMEIIDDYIESKFMKENERQYPHPLLKTVLGETYGFMVYQEQVMECAKVIAGYSLGGADLLRRAMGKKKPEEMKKQREIFVTGAAKHNGVSAEKANELFDLIDKFSGYGFNKSHAAAYSYLAYQTAYLKHYFPEEFLTANLNSNLGKLDTDKIAVLLDDCKQNNISILNPDVNHSIYDFKIEGKGAIRYSLGAIKGVGEKAVQVITQDREKNGPYLDFYDFLERVGRGPVNKRVMEALVKAGAFDSMNPNRAQVYESIAEGLDYVTKFRSKQLENISVLGNALEDAEPSDKPVKKAKKKKVVEAIKPTMKDIQPWDEITTAQNEKACLGIYLTINPYIDYYTKKLDGFKVSTPLAQLQANNEKASEDDVNENKSIDDMIYEHDFPTEAFIGGMVENIKWWKSKKGAFVTISDGTSTVDVRMFEDFLNNNKDWLKEGAFLATKVKVEVKEDQVMLSCQNGFNFEQTRSLLVHKIYVGSENTEENKQKFNEICNQYVNQKYPELNDTNVVLCVRDEETKRMNKKEQSIDLISDPKLLSDLEATFGENLVKPQFKKDIDNVRFPEVKSKNKGKNNYNKARKSAFVS